MNRAVFQECSEIDVDVARPLRDREAEQRVREPDDRGALEIGGFGGVRPANSGSSLIDATEGIWGLIRGGSRVAVLGVSGRGQWATRPGALPV